MKENTPTAASDIPGLSLTVDQTKTNNEGNLSGQFRVHLMAYTFCRTKSSRPSSRHFLRGVGMRYRNSARVATISDTTIHSYP